MALGFMSCNNDGKDIVVKETDYTEVFLNAFEEKLSLLFQTAERDLRRGNHDFELLFKNAYLEVLGSYADINVFEDAFWSASNMTYSVQARSRSVDEQLFVDLTHEIINSSETKKDAVGSFDRLANDASLSLENRVSFIGMREFLIFYKNNEMDIIYIIIDDSEDWSEYEIELRWRQVFRCLVNTRLRQYRYGAYGCLYGLAVGAPAKIPGMLVGCAVGSMAGGIIGGVTGLQDYCL